MVFAKVVRGFKGEERYDEYEKDEEYNLISFDLLKGTVRKVHGVARVR